MSPMGRQWFPLTFRDESERWRGCVAARPTLDAFLDSELGRHGLNDNALVLVGFSQGTMMVLHAGLRRRASPLAIIGYSGMLVMEPGKGPEIARGGAARPSADPAGPWLGGQCHPRRGAVHVDLDAGRSGPYLRVPSQPRPAPFDRWRRAAAWRRVYRSGRPTADLTPSRQAAGKIGLRTPRPQPVRTRRSRLRMMCSASRRAGSVAAEAESSAISVSRSAGSPAVSRIDRCAGAISRGNTAKPRPASTAAASPPAKRRYRRCARCAPPARANQSPVYGRRKARAKRRAAGPPADRAAFRACRPRPAVRAIRAPHPRSRFRASPERGRILRNETGRAG